MSETVYVEKEAAQPKSKSKNELMGWIRFILMLTLVYIVFTYVIGLSIVEGDSMNPTLETNGVLLSLNAFAQPEAGDVVIFNNEYGFSVVKRVIGVPGDTIAIEDGLVSVNGTILNEDYITGVPDNMSAIQVADNSYFVLGDNRTPGESLDSRSNEVGFVKAENLKGEVLVSLFPLKFP